MKQVAVIVGRFQVPYLTAGHIDFINRTLDENPDVLIVFGVAPAPLQPDNILTVEMRKQMFTKLFPVEKLRFAHIVDCGNDDTWSRNLDGLLHGYCETKGYDSAKVYGSRDSFLNSYGGENTGAEVPHRYSASGTALRAKVMETTEFSDEFRAGMIWCATNRHPINYATCDVVVGRNDYDEILLVRKHNSMSFCLIGGFADPKSDSYEDDAAREVLEETGNSITYPEYIGSRKIDDWRYRKSPDKIKTMLWAAKSVTEGEIQDTGEIAEKKWFHVSKVFDVISKNHLPLFQDFLNWRTNYKLTKMPMWQKILLDTEGIPEEDNKF